MTTQFKNYTVDIIDEPDFVWKSTNNTSVYDKEYFDDVEYQATSKHGIKVSEEGKHISSAIIGEVGGATGICDTSFVIKDDSLLICCCDAIYSFKLPELTLNWKKEFDMATCFSIYLFKNDFIIHGETQVTRIDGEGNEKWKFAARDIFVDPDGKECIEIRGAEIYLRDWQGYEYLLNEHGEELG